MRPKRYVRARTIRRALASALAVSYGIRSAGYVPPKIARRAMRDPAYFDSLARTIMFRKAITEVGSVTNVLFNVGRSLAKAGRLIGKTLDQLADTFAVARHQGETDAQFRERLRLLLSSA